MKGKFILPVIVVSQFFCISLWFAGNSIIGDLTSDLGLGPGFLAQMTSAVQFGFIIGTFIYALFAISDRFSPSVVFFISAVFAAIFNLGLCLQNIHPEGILFLRFLTGFFLAGIYPVGMKIASDHYQAGLGKSLGFLVGALVLGTAFPHLLKDATTQFNWIFVVYITSALSITGGLSVLLFIPDGPHRAVSQKLKISAFTENFRNKNFRSVAFGYFGHMWELYTFWAFVPVMIAMYNHVHVSAGLNIPFYSFLIIAIGAVACVASGFISQVAGLRKTAIISLSLSCLCCIASPLFLMADHAALFLSFLFFWGIVVIADSPLFSTLVALNAGQTTRGASLTFVNCIGFSITILSIQMINVLSRDLNPQYIYMFLAIGPAAGLIALFQNKNKSVPNEK